MKKSFTEKVIDVLIYNSKIYNTYFVESEYLVYSKDFKEREYYIIKGNKDNFLHLTGVSTKLKPSVFFEKCINNNLIIDDLFIKSKKQKGSIRRKIKVLEKALKMFLEKELYIEEKFLKNNINCAFASSDDIATIGFTNTKKLVPKTLLKGNELRNKIKVDLVLKKNIITREVIIISKSEKINENTTNLFLKKL